MQAEYITSKDVSFCHASNRREHQQLQPQYVHVYANVTEFVDCLTQHVVCNNIFHESLIKLMVLHMLKDRAAVLIHPRILQRLYPIRCGTCTHVVPGGLIVVSITRCFEADYPQAPSQNTGVGGALWRGTNGSTATPLSTRRKAMLENIRARTGEGRCGILGNACLYDFNATKVLAANLGRRGPCSSTLRLRHARSLPTSSYNPADRG
jgi:hypothetical protein